MAHVSVIIPAYNAEAYLGVAIESVLNQTYGDFEIIVVNDGSTDRTEDIATSYDERVECVNQTNSGVSEARNTGIGMSSGTLVAFLDADDFWKPNKLESQIKALTSNPNCGLCFTGVDIVDRTGGRIGKIEAVSYEDYCEALLLYLCVVSGSCSSAIIRKDIVDKIGKFDPEFSTCADWDYWLRASRMTDFIAVPARYVCYRDLEASMSSDPHLVEKDIMGVLDKFYHESRVPEDYLKLRNQVYSNHFMILAGEYIHNRKLLDSIRCIAIGTRLFPKNIVKPLGLPVRMARRLAMK